MLYRPRNLGGNLRRVTVDSVEHSSSQASEYLPSFHALEKSCKCPNCPAAGVSPRRKCWTFTCLTMVLARIKTSGTFQGTGDRNRGRGGSSNSPFQIMLQNNSCLFSKPKAVPNISANCLHSPSSPATQFCWRSPLQHSD